MQPILFLKYGCESGGGGGKPRQLASVSLNEMPPSDIEIFRGSGRKIYMGDNSKGGWH